MGLARSPAIEALRIRDYRRFWLANGGGSFALNFWFIGASWLVLELTDSPLAVGLVGGLAAAPSILLSLLGGALTDRLDRRRLLIGALAAWGGLGVLTGVLGSTGAVEAWQVLGIAAAIGVVDAASNPAWHTLVVDLVGKSRLVAANALAQVSEFAGEIVAPIPAGLIIAAAGVTPLFYVAGACLAFATVLMMTVPARRPLDGGAEVGEQRGRLLSDIRGGLAYTLSTPGFPALLALASTVLVSAAVFPFIPLYARDRLGVGAQGFGLMSAAIAGGMLAGALSMAALGRVRRQGLVILAARASWFVAMAVFAVSDSFALSMVLLVVMGAGGAVSGNLVLTQFQVRADDRMRGRVMSIVRMTDSLEPLGAVLGGGLAVALGNEAALLVCALAGGLALLAIGLASPSVWRE